MKTTFQTIKGTFDILPDPSESDGSQIAGSAGWNYVESTIRQVFARFGMLEIRTPILEPTELIARGIGQLTDIVSKEMFAFEKGDTHYVLRPEVTAPVMRAYLQHHLGQQGGAQRLFYIGPCFRAERPQKGRYRQFHQFGCEVIGSTEACADAEVIAAMMAVYQAFGIADTVLKINTLGDENSRPRYREALKTYLSSYQDRLSETSRQRLVSNPLRILDTKDERERELLNNAPLLIDYIDPESRNHFEQVKSYLQATGVAYEEDPFLVRGLDYYTRTAFELVSAQVGAQSALAGGGRYDLLAMEFGSDKPVPSVGFAAGMERLFLALSAANVPLPGPQAPDVYLVALGTDAMSWAFREAQNMRRNGLNVAYDLLARSMKAQMREANRSGARYTVIVGQNELETGRIPVKNMSSGEQADVNLGEITAYINAQRS